MTFAELKRAVMDLGFDGEVDDGHILVTAANLAVAQINRLRQRSESMILDRTPPASFVSFLRVTPDADTETGYEDTAMLSFDVCGIGKYTVFCGGEKISVSAVECPEYRTDRFLFQKRENVKLSFSGDLRVRQLSFWGSPCVKSALAVPVFTGISLVYDMKSLDQRISGILNLPMDESGNTLRGGTVSGWRISVPPLENGTFTVCYTRRPSAVTLDSFEGDEEADVPDGAEDLLPLLVSYYVWLDDSPEKAQEYRRLYSEQAALYLASRRTPRSATQRTKNGWEK